MAPQSRGRPNALSQQRIGLGLSHPVTPDESTPRAPNDLDRPPFSTSSIDGDDDDEEEDDADFQSHYSLDAGSSSGSSGDEMDNAHSTVGGAPFLHHSNSSFLIANAFAPPFYNRPPTPLPPSPSLTSLLRPTFSTTNSRPTTPDSSENDTPNDTEAAVAKSARTATTVPRASPKVPTYEYYGFVLYLTSSLVFRMSSPSPSRQSLMASVMYLLWSYLPSPFLHQLGIYYYPNRWWSLAIPAFLVIVLVYIYVGLACYNTEYLTLPMRSIENIVDEAANVAVLDSRGKIKSKHVRGKQMEEESAPGQHESYQHDWRSLWNEGTDAVMDVPIGGVCEILYGS